jgi:hypothetical protein
LSQITSDSRNVTQLIEEKINGLQERRIPASTTNRKVLVQPDKRIRISVASSQIVPEEIESIRRLSRSSKAAESNGVHRKSDSA